VIIRRKISAFLIGVLIAIAQSVCASTKSDSLQKALSQAESNQEKISLLNQLSDDYRGPDLDKSEQYADSALHLSQQSGDAVGEAMSLNNLGAVQMLRGGYAQALEFQLKALEKSNEDLVGRIHNDIGQLYGALGDDSLALAYLQSGLDARKKTGNKKEIADSYNCLGIFFCQRGELQMGKKYLLQYKDVSESLEDWRSVAKACTNLGSVSKELGDYKAALVFLQLALKIHKDFDNTGGVMGTWLNIGAVYGDLGEDEKALAYYDSCLTLPGSENFPKNILLALENKYIHHYNSDNYKEALQYADTILELREVYFNSKMTGQIAEIQTQYDVRGWKQVVKERDKDLERKKYLTWFLGAGIALLLLIILILFINHRQRTKLAAKEKQLQQQAIDDLLHNQEMASMNAMLEGQEKERKRIAQDLHDRLGSMLSTVKLHFQSLEGKVNQQQQESDKQFKKAFQLLDDLVEEVRKVSNNIVSGVLMKFGLVAALADLRDTIMGANQVQLELVTYNLDERLETPTEIALYRIVQELLSNALKHAQATELTVNIQREEDTLRLLVEDNGIGFDQAAVQGGMGLKNIESRVANLGGKLTIDSEKGRGTTVIVEVELNKT